MFPIVAGALKITQALLTQVIASATTVNGTVIDTAGYEGEIIFVLNSAAASASDTLAAVVEDSEDGTTFGAMNVAAQVDPDTGDNDTFSTVTDAANSGVQQLVIKKDLSKRYQRLSVTTVGTGVSIAVSAIAILPKKNF